MKKQKNNKNILSSYLIIDNFTINIFQMKFCNHLTDITLIFFSVGSAVYSIISWVTINNITSIGFIMVSIFSSTSFILLRKIRYYNDFENSINILKEENNKLKKNNEELQENIYTLLNIAITCDNLH